MWPSPVSRNIARWFFHCLFLIGGIWSEKENSETQRIEGACCLPITEMSLTEGGFDRWRVPEESNQLDGKSPVYHLLTIGDHLRWSVDSPSMFNSIVRESENSLRISLCVVEQRAPERQARCCEERGREGRKDAGTYLHWSRSVIAWTPLHKAMPSKPFALSWTTCNAEDGREESGVQVRESPPYL